MDFPLYVLAVPKVHWCLLRELVLSLLALYLCRGGGGIKLSG